MRLRTIKRLFLLTGLLFTLQDALADEAVTFTADAPKSVVMGQQFRLVYSSNREIRDLRIPEIADFEILMGPTTSTMSETTIIGGRVSSSTVYQFTYILYPKKTGTFTLEAATATINKENKKSNSLTINVLPADNSASAGNSRNQGQTSAQNRQQATSTAPSVSSEHVFIRAIPSKTTVYEQEALTITYKLYTRVDIVGFENPKFPEFKGFMAQEVDLPGDQQWDLEHYNGMNYRTAILKQTVLFPRETGSLTIGNGSFDVIVQVRVPSPRRGSIFDDFFDSYQEVKKTIQSNPVSIHVKSLPSGKPSDFSGVSGQLRLQSSVSSTQVKTNDAVTIKLNLTGSGNLKLIPTLELDFPQDFEVYDPKVENKFTVTANGVSGTKTIEYLIIPRYAGNFEIPAVTMSYFDLASNSYKTVTTNPITLQVAKGEGGSSIIGGNYTDKEQLRLLGSDIRYIKTNATLKQNKPLILGQNWFWIMYVALIVFFSLFLYINRKQAKANADISRVRNRKANRVAVKRLKLANKYLIENNKELFYEEVLKALWGYTGDKLNIPLSRLSKESIDSELTAFNVGEEIRNQYSSILETCEYARYSPASGNQAMDDIYKKTMDVINKMENTIKK